MNETKAPLIYGKILDIQEELPAILKNRAFEQNGRTMYKFRGIDDLYNAVNPLFKKHRVFMTPTILEHDSSEKPSAQGKVLFYEKMVIQYKVYAEDGSFIEASTKGIGMDSGDKAGNKAMSVAQKYALIQIFSIPTDEAKDPESDTHEVDAHSYDIEAIGLQLQECNTVDEVKALFSSLGSPESLKKIFAVRYNHLKA